MNLDVWKTWQPNQEVWSKGKLVHECAIALGNVMDKSTLSNYSSALNSYLNFVTQHDFPVKLTSETLSFFTVYMCHHINPWSVNTYLTGISQQLETYFPDIKNARNSPLVHRTLQGCMRMRGRATVCKRALTVDDLHLVTTHYQNSHSHDDLLFISMLLTGFFGLLWLGEMTFPDDLSLQNWKKVTRRNTVKLSDTQYKFLLPGHKADHFFEGNKIIIMGDRFGHHPLLHFNNYLASCDNLHPITSPLWLMANGKVPTWSIFISRLRLFFMSDIAGQSMWAGGTTALAEHSVPPAIIHISKTSFFFSILSKLSGP